MALSRRDFLASFTALSAGLAVTIGPLGVLPAYAADDEDGKQYDVDALMKKGPLDDIVIGEADAPITMIEYFSLTCGHCAHFHQVTYKHLEEKYIKTGKLRFIPREFPLDPLAAAGAMLARCVPGGKSEAMIALLLEEQKNWAYTNDPVGGLQKLARQAGFTQETFEKCLTDQKLLDDITAVRERGHEEFGIDSTPTFFINGQKRIGALSSEEFDKILEPLLK